MNDQTSLYDRTYTASEVSRIVGMNSETLRVWRRRKHVVLEGDGPGWTRFTFNDLMLVAAYHNLVQSHCSHALAEMIAGQIQIDIGGKWAGILGAESGVFCFCNLSLDGTRLTIETVVGVDALNEKIKAALRDPASNPTYQIVDCTALFLKILLRISELNKKTPEDT